MAQKAQTLYIDDLDGSTADGTVRFGRRYARIKYSIRHNMRERAQPEVMVS